MAGKARRGSSIVQRARRREEEELSNLLESIGETSFEETLTQKRELLNVTKQLEAAKLIVSVALYNLNELMEKTG